MSIPSSYLTTMAWEKFVGKHDDFMRNFKTKVENEKRNKKLCFLIKWWFWEEFGLFRSRSTPSCLWSCSFYSFLSYYCRVSVRLPFLNRRACTSGGGASLELSLRQKDQSHDVAHEAWQRPYFERSWTYSLRSWSYTFEPLQEILDPWSPSPYRLQSRGGVKGLVGFLESCAAIAVKTERYTNSFYSDDEEAQPFVMYFTSRSSTDQPVHL